MHINNGSIKKENLTFEMFEESVQADFAIDIKEEIPDLEEIPETFDTFFKAEHNEESADVSNVMQRGSGGLENVKASKNIRFYPSAINTFVYLSEM